MTITIVSPLPGPIGPGFQINIGDLPTPTIGDQVFVSLVDADGLGTALGGKRLTSTSSNVVCELGLEEASIFGVTRFASVSHAFVTGQTIKLRVDVLDSASHFKERTDTSGYTYEPSSGLTGLLESLRTMIPDLTSGFTAEDRTTLEAVNASTNVQMGVGGSIAQIPLSSLLSKPPVGFLRVNPTVHSASGEGSLDGDHGLLPTLFGLWWEFTTVPDGIGSSSGVVEEFEIRMLQLRTIYSLDGVEFVRDFSDFNVQRVLWFWDEAKPSRVEYAIAPGVVVAFHYIEWVTA